MKDTPIQMSYFLIDCHKYEHHLIHLKLDFTAKYVI